MSGVDSPEEGFLQLGCCDHEPSAHVLCVYSLKQWYQIIQGSIHQEKEIDWTITSKEKKNIYRIEQYHFSEKLEFH